MGERADAGAAPTLVPIEFFQQFQEAVVAGVEVTGQGGDFPGQFLPVFEPGLRFGVGVLQVVVGVSLAGWESNMVGLRTGSIWCWIDIT